MEKYNKLTVIETFRKPRNNGGTRLMAKCLCDCGTERIVQVDNLKNNHTQSCGCHKKKIHTKHGLAYHPLYKVWEGIVNRCYAPNAEVYKFYGARGIGMCQTWRSDPKSFIEWAISQGWKEGLSVDRTNNNGNYDPENCQITTQQKQMRNTRRNVYVTMDGETKCISEWSAQYGIDRYKLRYRLKKGMSLKEALEI